MATNVVYNVFNGDDCAFESMTKEQIYELIANSIAQGELAGVDAENPFITRIKEQNKGVPLTFWVGTQAEFNAIETKANNCFYIITDSTAQADIENALAELKTSNEGLVTASNKAAGYIDMLKFAFPSVTITPDDSVLIGLTTGHEYRVAYCTVDGTRSGFCRVQYYSGSPNLTYTGGDETLLDISVTGTRLFCGNANSGQDVLIIVMPMDSAISFK